MNIVNISTSIAFYEALQRLAESEPRITIKENGNPAQITPIIYVDGGSEHAYTTYAGFGESKRPIVEWRGHVRLTYSTEKGIYDVINLDGLPYTDYLDGTKQAQIVINAVKAHMATGFHKPF